MLSAVVTVGCDVQPRERSSCSSRAQMPKSAEALKFVLVPEGNRLGQTKREAAIRSNRHVFSKDLAFVDRACKISLCGQFPGGG